MSLDPKEWVARQPKVEEEGQEMARKAQNLTEGGDQRRRNTVPRIDLGQKNHCSLIETTTREEAVNTRIKRESLYIGLEVDIRLDKNLK